MVFNEEFFMEHVNRLLFGKNVTEFKKCTLLPPQNNLLKQPPDGAAQTVPFPANTFIINSPIVCQRKINVKDLSNPKPHSNPHKHWD